MTEKIIPCPECKGTGKQEQIECTDYHHNDHDVWDDPCGNCDGTGRMVEQTTIRKLRKDELTLRKRYPDEDKDISNDMPHIRQKVMEVFWNGHIYDRHKPSVNAKNNRLVKAIQTLREMTGCGLSECKNMILKWKDLDIGTDAI